MRNWRLPSRRSGPCGTWADAESTVTSVLVHDDTDLYDLTVKEQDGRTEVIDTTSSHLFWDPAGKRWVSASKLKKGEQLKTADGTTATADGGTVPADHDGWMWDLTVPGDGDHDFYVLPADGGGPVGNTHYLIDGTGVTAVLVHNIDCARAGKIANRVIQNAQSGVRRLATVRPGYQRCEKEA